MASDLSTEDAGKLAHTLQHKQAQRVLLEVGDSSTAVAELQRELGISDDGQFGPHTRAAVKAFQLKHGLKPTGKVDVKTWLKLFPTDMIVYAPPGSTSALGVNDTNHAEWAAVSTAAAKNESGVAKLGHAAAAKAAAHGHGKSDPGLPGVHAASMGATGPAVGIPNVPNPGGGGPGLGIPGIPGLHGGAIAPNGGGGGGGGGQFHFPSLGSFGSAKGMIRAMIRMANRIDSHHYAYRWGGGHNSSFSGPYDCSGAVSAVLHAAGLLSSPRVSGGFMHWGAPGRGAVTIYANAGHVYMSILGRFFGTSGANPGGGAGWFPGGARSGFAVVHVPFSKLHFKSHKKKHKKKVRRHKAKAHTRQPSHESGPLNQPETTPAPNSGGSRAPSGGTQQPGTTTANRQQSAPAGSQPAATPNQQPAQPAPSAPPAQQQTAPPAPSVVNAPQAPQTAQPVTGTGGPVGTTTPNPVQVPQAPTAPAAPTPSAPAVRAPQAGVPQAPKPPAAQPNQPAQQPQAQQQPRPQQPAAAPQAVQHAAEQVAQAPSSQPPKPPAGSGQGSTPNSGN